MQKALTVTNTSQHASTSQCSLKSYVQQQIGFKLRRSFNSCFCTFLRKPFRFILETASIRHIEQRTVLTGPPKHWTVSIRIFKTAGNVLVCCTVTKVITGTPKIVQQTDFLCTRTDISPSRRIKPWFHVKIKLFLKNFRPEPPPSVDRPKIILFHLGATSEMK